MKKEPIAKAVKIAQNKPKKSTEGNPQPKTKNAAEGQIKRPTKVFSFRGDEEDVKAWRLYAAIKGIKVDEIGSEAMNAYIKKHPLQGAEVELFNARMER